MAKLTALLLAGLFVVAAARDQDKMSRLIWTTPTDNSKCTMKKQGDILTSGDCELQVSDDDLAAQVATAMAGMDDLVADVNDLKSEVAEMESYVDKFDGGVHRLLCKNKVTPTTLMTVDGARAVHGDAFCRYNCKTGFHDAGNNGNCVACLETCDQGYKLTGACTTTTKPTCELDLEYCPASLPSDLTIPDATALPLVNARSIGHTLNVVCKESKYKSTITCGADRKWTTDGSCSGTACLGACSGTNCHDGMKTVTIEGETREVFCTYEVINGKTYGFDAQVYHGHRTYRRTDRNSCPTGTDIWVPRSKSVLEAVFRQFGSNANGMGIYRTSNGCGGCTGHAMVSGGEQTRRGWTSVAAVPEPWFLRSVRYGEPNGDYSANCWLGAWGRDGHGAHFNDLNCGYSYTTYVCSTNPEWAQTH
jgi:hypothetical protein